MRTLLLLALLLASLSTAGAEEFLIEVPTTAVTAIAYHGGTAHRFQVSLPEGLTESTLLKATLHVVAGPAAGSQDDFVEVQVAEWRDGAPVVPAQKVRPITLGFETNRPVEIHLDLRPILADWTGGASLDLAVGKLTGDCWGDPQVAPLEPGQQGFCKLHLVTE
ncbi:hypothetical protein FJ251_12905 [bacterium]|nr:hypothetical protein [bacterium]